MNGPLILLLTLAGAFLQAERLSPCRLPGVPEEVRCTTVSVLEDRDSRRGRRIDLRVVVLPARSRRPQPDPFVVISGGPGATSTDAAALYWRSWLRDERDVVLIDQRGTGVEPLDCDTPGSDEHPEDYLAPIFSADVARACRAQLERRADLRHYTSAPTIDDLEEVRQRLGYGKVNLYGSSWGTRGILVYLRRHPRSVRTATMLGVSPISHRNPLSHASAAQQGLDVLLAECARQAACGRAFPNLRAELYSTLERLRDAPANVMIVHPVTGAPLRVTLTKENFAEALRVMTYDVRHARQLPRLIHAAHEGDLAPFAQLALESNRELRRTLQHGVLLSITCSEDVSRIHAREIDSATAGSYLGAARVHEQLAACAEWPRGVVPEGYAEPVRSRVPALLISGTADPVTPPRFGAEAARTLSAAMHVVAPGFHVPLGPCIVRIMREFVRHATVQGLDTSCVSGMKLPDFEVGDATLQAR